MHRLPKASEYTSPVEGRQTKAARVPPQSVPDRAPPAIHRLPVDNGDNPRTGRFRPHLSCGDAVRLDAAGGRPESGAHSSGKAGLFRPPSPEKRVRRSLSASLGGTEPRPSDTVLSSTERNALSPLSPPTPKDGAFRRNESRFYPQLWRRGWITAATPRSRTVKSAETKRHRHEKPRKMRGSTGCAGGRACGKTALHRYDGGRFRHAGKRVCTTYTM